MATFDASALVAALLGEPAGIISGRMLADGAGHAICALNAAEVVDAVGRTRGHPAELVAATVQLWVDSGLRIVPLDWARAARAAELRSVHDHRTRTAISLADCGALALAEQRGTELVTSGPALIRVARAVGIDVVALPDSSGRVRK